MSDKILPVNAKLPLTCEESVLKFVRESLGLKDDWEPEAASEGVMMV